MCRDAARQALTAAALQEPGTSSSTARDSVSEGAHCLRLTVPFPQECRWLSFVPASSPQSNAFLSGSWGSVRGEKDHAEAQAGMQQNFNESKEGKEVLLVAAMVQGAPGVAWSLCPLARVEFALGICPPACLSLRGRAAAGPSWDGA